jgi:hypothetical protein
MKRIIELKCIICYTPFLRRARYGENGRNVRNRTMYKKIVRPITTDTCSRECSKRYRAIYTRLMGRRFYRDKIRGEKYEEKEDEE